MALTTAPGLTKIIASVSKVKRLVGRPVRAQKAEKASPQKQVCRRKHSQLVSMLTAEKRQLKIMGNQEVTEVVFKLRKC